MDGACWVCSCCRHSPSRTWISGSFESMRWNACVHRVDLSLYSHPKEFLGNEVRNHVSSKRKIPSAGGSKEVWTCGAASRRTESPAHYWLSYSGPCNELTIRRPWVCSPALAHLRDGDWIIFLSSMFVQKMKCLQCLNPLHTLRSPLRDNIKWRKELQPM